LNADKLRAMGWSPQIELREGVAGSYQWFLGHACEA
jgi:GDP-L-fucose synthase